MGDLDELPAVLDIRDDLRRAREDADRDLREDLSGVYDRLEEYTERDRATREGVLDEVDNELLRLEERVSGEAERRLTAARNRIQTYRESLSEAGENLVVLETSLRRVDDDTTVSLADVADERAVATATVVNEGERRAVMAAVEFYDDDNERLHEGVGDRTEIDAGEQRAIEVETRVPAGARYFAVTILDAGEQPDGTI